MMSSLYENQYESKIKLQMENINEVDASGAQHLEELEREAKDVTLDYDWIKEDFSSYDDVLGEKKKKVDKIIPQSLSKDDMEEIGKWDSMMMAYSQSMDRNFERVEVGFVLSERVIEGKKIEISRKFSEIRSKVEEGVCD